MSFALFLKCPRDENNIDAASWSILLKVFVRAFMGQGSYAADYIQRNTDW